jgi:hypothetical protein
MRWPRTNPICRQPLQLVRRRTRSLRDYTAFKNVTVNVYSERNGVFVLYRATTFVGC